MTGRRLKRSDNIRIGWCTPKPIIDVVRESFGGSIDLDPCSNASSIVGAKENWIYTEKDALKDRWSGNVYINPPYSREHNMAFSLAWRANASSTRAQIALVPAATGSTWFRNYITASTCVAFIGRVRFIGAPNATPFDLALVYRGQRPNVFRRALQASRYGKAIILWTSTITQT